GLITLLVARWPGEYSCEDGRRTTAARGRRMGVARVVDAVEVSAAGLERDVAVRSSRGLAHRVAVSAPGVGRGADQVLVRGQIGHLERHLGRHVAELRTGVAPAEVAVLGVGQTHGVAVDPPVRAGVPEAPRLRLGDDLTVDQ